MLSERSSTTTPIRSGGTSACSLVCGSRAVAAAARTRATAPPARTSRTRPVRRMTERSPATSCVSTDAAGPTSRRKRPLVPTTVPVRVDGPADANGEAARLVDLGVVLRPRERSSRARELGVVEVEDLGNELERPPTVLGAVRAARILEELERLLERREHDD